MAELKGLKVKRCQFKAQLKRFGTFIESSELDSIQEIQERLDKLLPIWDKYQNIQNAILEVRKGAIPEGSANESEEIEKIETEEEEQDAMFEDSYFKFVAIAKRRLIELNSHAEPTAVVLSEAVPTIKTNVKLPTITLPTFNGQ